MSSRDAWRIARAALVLLAALALGACSTTAMKATPIWDDEHRLAEGTPEERVNFWPIYYRRDPAVSVLWPLITVTGEGHAVVPFYDYHRGEEVLRLGTVHPVIPPLAKFERDYWRVLNVIRREKTLFVVPLYHQNEKGVWTPLVTWREELRGVLGPAFHRYEKGNATWWAAPWPIEVVQTDGQRRGFHVFPLAMYYRSTENALEHKRSSSWTNVGLVLFQHYSDDNVTKTSWLWPLGHLGRTKTQRASRFFPLWLYKSDAEKDTEWLSIAFPFFHRYRGQGYDGHALIPLYVYNKGDGAEFYSLPLSFAKDGSYLGILGPLYVQVRNKETGGTLRSALFPLSGFWSKPEGRGSWIAPLYLENETAEGNRLLATPLFVRARRDGKQRTYSPLVSWGTVDDADFINVGGLLFHHWKTEHGSYTGALLPFIGTSRYRDERNTYAFPLFYVGRDGLHHKRRLALGLLYNDRIAHAGEEAMREELFKRFHTVRAWPVPETHSEIIRRHNILLLFLAEKSIVASRPPVPPLADGETLDIFKEWPEVAREDVTFHTREVSRLFPLYSWRQEGDERRFNILWRVYDEDREPIANSGGIYTRQRVLWRLYHRETIPGRSAIDVFPFVAYDRAEAEQLKKLTVAGGLYEFRREGDSRRVKVCFIPINLRGEK